MHGVASNFAALVLCYNAVDAQYYRGQYDPYYRGYYRNNDDIQW